MTCEKFAMLLSAHLTSPYLTITKAALELKCKIKNALNNEKQGPWEQSISLPLNNYIMNGNKLRFTLKAIGNVRMKKSFLLF